LSPVSPYEHLQEGDRLIFTGIPSTIIDLQKIQGLSIETDARLDMDNLRNKNSQLIEAVVSANSYLLNKTVKQTTFEADMMQRWLLFSEGMKE
jgi:hypothetical protein